MKELEQLFEKPGCAYRGKPFWAWNGKLDARELRRQIRTMKKMGLGGFFMHSRVGLGTPYLSKEWFEMIRACIDEADKQDMEAWLYDEDRWPSGAAGGLVTKDPKYAMKFLQIEITTPARFKKSGDLVAVFAAELKDGVPYSPVRLSKASEARDVGRTNKVLAFRQCLSEESPWYNGHRYLDTLSHDAVKKFIETTHDAYAREVGTEFGRLVPGIFTDEPNYGGIMLRRPKGDTYEIPWTEKLASVFEKRYGYDLLDHLPELFFDVDGEPISDARYHYFDCITFLFSDAFSRQIGEWCEKHNIMHTGHVLSEEALSSQATVVGSAMRFYEHMQAPGIDMLTEHRPEHDTAKQCASVAEQMGRRWVLSELYGCTGWQFPFEGHKAIGDWQAALGVNLRCQHLYWYTMAGQAKRDYPASIAHQSPWCELYPEVEDYFARVQTLLSRGKALRNLLVIHPIESTWLRMTVNGLKSGETERLDKRMQDLRKWLLEAHLDFDYGDEDMLSRLGRISHAKSGPLLFLGKASYSCVLVPPLLTIRGSTLKFLKAFQATGGNVVYCKPLPQHVDALKSSEATDGASEAKVCAFTRSAVVSATEPARTLSIRKADGRAAAEVLYNLRTEGSKYYLFVCNTNRKRGTGPLEILFKEKQEVEYWDPQTGKRWKADFAPCPEGTLIRTSLSATGSALFVLKKKCGSKLKALPKITEVSRTKITRKKWTVRLSEPNVLVLDRAKFRMEKGAWKGPVDILELDGRVRDAIGIPRRGGAMVQPWARTAKSSSPSTALALSYSFRAESLPAGPLYLAVEQPERLQMKLNGAPLDSDTDAGWWSDPAIRLIPVNPNLIVSGRNQLELTTKFDEESNLEAIFLLGAFGVRVRGTDLSMVQKPATLRTVNWVNQGLPFYSGTVSYVTDIRWRKSGARRVYLCVPRFAGSCIRVFVNGEAAGVIGWEPNEMDVTERLKEGANQLVIEVLSHRRNSFGPLHHRLKTPPWTGAGEFVTKGDDRRDDYNLVTCGLLSEPYLSLRE